ncbi:SAM hydrolase/SAM-dependent halogenase family protein [Natronogracilivirga saccharolytica]|uniref:SAM-dependent chlorinase/fluorinase n=1 Tax=Natronogracilivirga saccharolytica TaxID=2812953 RepID=A0A8J7RGM5_9BACT|nr:SAM-dependent chlorinase/fluorinase [Natronogracilivirga saccharolytica]MBP3191515.1 SAM-dependent chlorinase/fluorinase [Natronogracilivirga saccharolytica]
MSSTSRIITLTTDFGSRDYYVSAMKAVILGISPNVRLVDISHDIPPQDVMAAAWILKNTAFLYPPGTVHLAVVDPGVGSMRKPLLVKIRDQFFVGPDNGLFSLVMEDETSEVIELDNRSYWRDAISATFHGRDIFAPVAAWLCEQDPEEGIGKFGTELTELTRYKWAKPISDEEGIQGWIVHIDRYGNLITNIPDTLIKEKNIRSNVKIYAGNTILKKISRSYTDVPDGEAIALIGSSGMLEIAINKGSAEQMLGIEKGAPVSLVVQKNVS